MPTFRNTLSVPSSQVGRCIHTAYEDGTDRVFRNVGIKNSNARELPRRKHTTFRTQRKFEIKNSKTTYNYTYGRMFLATACMINKAASLESHVTPVPCKLMNICLKQLDDPTMKTTSLISSETFRRKSAKSSPSSSKPSCYNHTSIMLQCTLVLFEDSHGV